MSFIIFISAIILLRLTEVLVARRNEKWMLQQGAVVYGASHYPYMILLHTLFFVSLLVEYWYRQPMHYSSTLIIIYILLLFIKLWVVSSLGKYWNTKIIRIPNTKLVNKGPYRYIKHPNYIIVVAEIVLIPLCFHLYFTAICFSILNAIMLYVRIRVENKTLDL
jgi:methyltransferase